MEEQLGVGGKIILLKSGLSYDLHNIGHVFKKQTIECVFY